VAKRDRLEAAEVLQRLAAAVESGELDGDPTMAFGLRVGADTLRSVR
jgi:hypothetical protein